MGLDITAYSHLKHIGKHVEGWCEIDDHVNAYAYDCFPNSFRGIPIIAAEMSGGSQFLVGGCFETTSETETHHFRAGSYSGYNAWRSDLQARFNSETLPDLPFYELIYFADNEGSIGPDAAADLLADFRDYADVYSAGAPDDQGVFGDWWITKYQDWTRACELATAGGLIRFC